MQQLAEPSLLNLTYDVTRHICDLFNCILSYGVLPNSWHEARQTLLFKSKTGNNLDDPNLYRGIASERTLKKIFCKLIVARLSQTVEKAIPPEQFGFRKGLGTRDAIHVLQSEIERAVAKSNKPLYAVFIDCVKAFDRAPRNLLIDSFRKAGVGGPLLRVLFSLLDGDSLLVDSGGGNVIQVEQNLGTPQGNPLSCLAFSLLLSELPEFIREEFRHSLVVMYADNIVIAHYHHGAITAVVNRTVDFLRQRGLEVNVQKTKAVKFRRSGRTTTERILCNGDPLEFVNSFTYLGLLLHYSGKSFAEHIRRRVTAALAALAIECNDVRKLSVSAAVALFELEIVPMLSYALDRVWGHLTESCFEALERCFCTYMKRVRCLHPKARNRFVYLLAGYGPALETIRMRLKAPTTEPFLSFVYKWQGKVAEALAEVGNLDIYLAREMWAERGCQSRHVYTRYIVHGYHHVVCSNRNYHQPDDQCVCRFCSQSCAKYHATACGSFDESLHSLSRYQRAGGVQ